MSPDRPLGIALQLTDLVDRRVVGGRTYESTVRTARDVVELAQRLEPTFDRLWLTDNLGYRNTSVLLSAIAASTSTLDLGTFTAYPYGRSPLDVATMLSTLSELLQGRDLAFGISRGSRAVAGLYGADRPLRLLREHIDSLKLLLAGETVDVDSRPALGAVHGLNPGGTLRLETAPAEVPILLTSTGQRTLRLAGAVADGVQFVSQQPTQSAALLSDPTFPALSGLEALEAALHGRARSSDGFRRVYGISVSVASDPDAAIDFARRQVAGVLATKTDAQLRGIGVDPDLADRVRTSLDRDGLAEASRHVPRDVVSALVATGSAADVAERISECIERSQKWGFEEHFVCFPLGPDIRDAVDTIVDDVLPSLR